MRVVPWVFATAIGAGPVAAGEVVPVFDAAAARQFFNARGCNACHALDEQRLAPPFRAIAARYRETTAGDGGRALEDALVRKVLEGGAGAWGLVPMISNPRLPPAEARAAVRWILAQAARAP